MLVSTLKKEIAFLATDPTMRQVSSEQLLVLINQAVDDLIGYGWLTPMIEDTTLLMVDGTYNYLIPADWAYIEDILTEGDTGIYDDVIPQHQWRIELLAGGPYVVFNSYEWGPIADSHLKLIGQKRPARYASDAATVDPLFIPFIRDRATAAALEYMACQPIPNAELAAQEFEQESPPGSLRPPKNRLPMRIQQLHTVAQMKWSHSHMLASCHPMEFRVSPSAIHVLGR